MKLPLNYKLEQKRDGLNFLILIKEQTVIIKKTQKVHHSQVWLFHYSISTWKISIKAIHTSDLIHLVNYSTGLVFGVLR